MPRGVYNRATRPDATPTARRATVNRDENWGKRTRKIKGEVNYRELIQPHEIPADATYQWKSVFTLAKLDENKLRLFHENGWSPVPHARHSYMPKMEDFIVDQDAMLMEQPIELYHEARDAEEDARNAQMQMGRDSIRQTAKGQMERRDLGTNVKTEAMVIEADDSRYEREKA